jgi:hypothetical protein
MVNRSFFHRLISTDTMKKNTRFLGSPFAIGAFILSVLTGLLFIYNFVIGMPQSMHLLLSCSFVIAVVLHTIVNWKQFT